MPTVTFTRDEYVALKPCFADSSCALGRKLVANEPIEITRIEAQEALLHLRRFVNSIPPDELRPHYHDKLCAIAGEMVVCETLREWLSKIIEHGGEYERADNPRTRHLGMRDTKTDVVFLLSLSRMSIWEWGMKHDPALGQLLRTPETRDTLARMLTTGDYCLDLAHD